MKEHCQCKREEVESKILLLHVVYYSLLVMVKDSFHRQRAHCYHCQNLKNIYIHHWIFGLSIADQHYQDIACLKSLSSVS